MSKNSTSGDFSRKKFVFSMIIRIFATSVPTKPLKEAQMRGAFLFPFYHIMGSVQTPTSNPYLSNFDVTES